jgi:hypothetical protein
LPQILKAADICLQARLHFNICDRCHKEIPADAEENPQEGEEADFNREKYEAGSPTGDIKGRRSDGDQNEEKINPIG